jgi:ABC-type bacteriocin/lantibiotic exporter with double-glycine peptidase domain
MMADQPPFGIYPLLKRFANKIGCTWFLVAIENALLALIPLLIGFAIDGLLAGNIDDLLNLAAVFLLLIVISVVRRIFDTRAYGSIRIALGLEVDDHHKKELVSIRNARLNMARELVDFLEEDVPELFTAVIQLSVAIIILAFIEPTLAYSAVVLLVVMVGIYAGFHQRFYRLNIAINNQAEQQVSILNQNCNKGLKQHLCNLRSQEVRLSDADAILYGLIFVFICLFILCNLSLSSTLVGITAGTIFSIVSYSWEFSESAIALPMTMQKLSRLNEISQRLNKLQ